MVLQRQPSLDEVLCPHDHGLDEETDEEEQQAPKTKGGAARLIEHPIVEVELEQLVPFDKDALTGTLHHTFWCKTVVDRLAWLEKRENSRNLLPFNSFALQYRKVDQNRQGAADGDEQCRQRNSF
jgi:hypothetical protein